MLDPTPLYPEQIRPLRRHEYERMVDLGLFDDERIELLRGSLVAMTPQKAPHAYSAARLGKVFERAVGDRAEVRQHSPIALTDDSEPEPDVAIVPLGDYTTALPTTALLVVEVADSSLRKDRKLKTDLYAEAGIGEYWIVNLVDRVLEVHRNPRGGRYTTVTTHGVDDFVQPVAFPEVSIRVGDFISS